MERNACRQNLGGNAVNRVRRVRLSSFHQQPGGDTPGVAAAPVALAGAIVPGIARFIVMLSAHADVLGVGITAMFGSILVLPSCVASC